MKPNVGVPSVVAGGARIPALGLGTWMLSGTACAERVEEALRMGYRHIDTAQMYGNEADVGRAMSRSGIDRGEIFLTTKLALENLRHAEVLASTRASLSRLQTDYVDLLLIHWPSEEVPLEETLGAMLELRDRGRVRHLGVSNFPPARLERALAHAPIVCNQVEYHPYLSQGVLLATLRGHGLALVAYSPLARGRVARERVLQQIGDAHGKTPAQVALRWLVQQPAVGVIPKAASSRHLNENLRIFDFTLSSPEIARIDALHRGERLVDPGWAPEWEA